MKRFDQTNYGVSLKADFETNEWTFQMKGEYAIGCGEYAIIDKQTYLILIENLGTLTTDKRLIQFQEEKKQILK